MSLLLTAVTNAGFRITPDTTGGVITFKFTGSCDSQTVTTLSQFLSDLHVEVVRVGAKTVILDCESLYFMNSSAMGTFVAWLRKIKDLNKLEQYKVTIKTNHRLAWQARSFGAICRTAPQVISIVSSIDQSSPPPAKRSR